MSRVAPGYFRDLAETVESLTAPNPAFDREIWETICQETGNPYHLNGQPKWPAYTASLDAAMTLVPRGYAVTEFMIWPGEPCELKIYGTRDSGGEFWHESKDGSWAAKAALPACAIVAAALRARAALPTTERGGS